MLSIDIGKLTESIRDVVSGVRYNTEVTRARVADIRRLTGTWAFDWQQELTEREVYKLVAPEIGPTVQGLMSLESMSDHIYVNLLESHPEVEMGLIREPQGVDFVIAGRPLNPAEAAEVSAFLQKGREQRATAARERLEAEALLLPTSERSRLAHRLIDSLTEVEKSPPSAKKPRTRSTARKQVRPLEKSRRRLVTSRNQLGDRQDLSYRRLKPDARAKDQCQAFFACASGFNG